MRGMAEAGRIHQPGFRHDFVGCSVRTRAGFDARAEHRPATASGRRNGQFLTAAATDQEVGAGCVTLAVGGWDTHDRNFDIDASSVALMWTGEAFSVEQLTFMIAV